jgi:hypothetical protein
MPNKDIDIRYDIHEGDWMSDFGEEINVPQALFEFVDNKTHF